VENDFESLYNDILNKSKNFDFEKFLSDADKKIINLLAKERIENQLRGEIFLFNTAIEFYKLDKYGEHYPNIRKYILLHLIADLYESILYHVDRRLLSYIHRNKRHNDKVVLKFLKINRDEYNHATAGEINQVICKILNLDINNESIFSINSEVKKLRNEVSHANFSEFDNYNLKEHYGRVFAFSWALARNEIEGQQKSDTNL